MTEPENKKTILLVEDDQAVLSTLSKHLEFLGYNVITASDGMEGLKLIENSNFDLVITDIVMPYVSGLGVVTECKAKKPHIPVIAITGYGKEPEAAALERKADLVLSKPVKMAVLKEYIEKLMPGS